LRVLLITDWAPVEAGTERYVWDLREQLRARGDDVALLTSSAGSAARGTADFVAHGSRTRAGRAFTQIANPAAWRAARRAVRSFRPDVVHVNMFLSFLSPAVLDGLGAAPAVVTLHDYRAISPTGTNMPPELGRIRRLREAIRRPAIRRGLERAARILTISSSMVSALGAAGVRSELLALPSPRPARHESRRAPNPVFVYGGRLDPEKGVDTLVRAFAALCDTRPDAELRICGDGRERARLEELASGLGCPVAFVPGMLGPGWWQAAEGAWASVSPARWAEPLGLVAIESILRGLPVIASDSGALRETVVPGRTGLLYPSGDVRGLATALDAVASGSALLPPLPEDEVERLAARHDPDAHVTRLREVYREVAA
jgi:glycosyltransferase involved in cell wall biosynthesis